MSTRSRASEAEAVGAAQAVRVSIGRVARRLRQLYAAEDSDGPSFNDVSVLVYLAKHGPASPTDVAAREHVTSQAIAAIIRDLEMGGLVRRTAHPTDGRKTVIAITAAGRKLLNNRELTVVGSLMTALETSLTGQERQLLESVVPILNKLADSL
ncbi:MAG TPA: MarR family transcriptional regulator [Acidothermaceae bacterium]|jgi:DNA-binding MarR family transcriptional regulator|nr:MarR family transcriptional regulator [Acidothermaceae bacterium]